MSSHQSLAFVKFRDGTNTLGVITFALVFGMVLGTVGERARALIESLRVIDEVIMKIVQGVMWYDTTSWYFEIIALIRLHFVCRRITPVGVASLIASKILSVDDIVTVTTQLGLFVLTVIAGVLLYQLVILQVLYFVVVRKNPFRFYAGLVQATITAFATASA